MNGTAVAVLAPSKLAATPLARPNGSDVKYLEYDKAFSKSGNRKVAIPNDAIRYNYVIAQADPYLYRQVENGAASDGAAFAEALRALIGATVGKATANPEGLSAVSALREEVQQLRAAVRSLSERLDLLSQDDETRAKGSERTPDDDLIWILDHQGDVRPSSLTEMAQEGLSSPDGAVRAACYRYLSEIQDAGVTSILRDCLAKETNPIVADELRALLEVT